MARSRIADRSPQIAGDAADEAAQQLLRFTSNLTPNFKFCRQATNKIVGTSDRAAAFLNGFF